MPNEDLMKKFAEHRDAALASTAERLDHPSFVYMPGLAELLAAEWPEAAEVFYTTELVWREVGRGHDGQHALCGLAYEIGNDQIGRRQFIHRWIDAETGWRWEPKRVPAGAS